MTCRRHALAILSVGALGALVPSGVRAGGQSEGSRDPYGPEQQLSWIPIRTKTNDRLRVDWILILTDHGAFAAGLDNNVYPRTEDRIGFHQDFPIIGDLFQPTIRARDLVPQAQVGMVYGLDQILVVETRRRLPSGAGAVPLEQALATLVQSPRADTALLALPGSGVQVNMVSTANDKSSYHVGGGAFRHVGPADRVPILTVVPGLDRLRLGEAYAKDRDMVLLVRPSIIDDWR